MNPFLGAESMIKVGVKSIIESDSPDGKRGVVFEDDGETGYFYARDYQKPEQLFVDALHIYTVHGVVDRDRACNLKIIWTQHFDAAALLINQRPHAIFHFGRRCGYAADPFPDVDPTSGWTHAPMEPTLKKLFFPDA